MPWQSKALDGEDWCRVRTLITWKNTEDARFKKADAKVNKGVYKKVMVGIKFGDLVAWPPHTYTCILLFISKTPHLQSKLIVPTLIIHV